MNTQRSETMLDRLRRQRGVAAVEVAMVLAVIAIPLLLAMAALEDSADDVIGDGGVRVGTPTECSDVC
ncbi:MAG: hypothetical protein HKN03_15430 [Acidimicrobiales bacterium]|nr:hypothetical protein [Acidimicrobiales bacterium]